MAKQVLRPDTQGFPSHMCSLELLMDDATMPIVSRWMDSLEALLSIKAFHQGSAAY